MVQVQEICTASQLLLRNSDVFPSHLTPKFVGGDLLCRKLGSTGVLSEKPAEVAAEAWNAAERAGSVCVTSMLCGWPYGSAINSLPC